MKGAFTDAVSNTASYTKSYGLPRMICGDFAEVAIRAAEKGANHYPAFVEIH